VPLLDLNGVRKQTGDLSDMIWDVPSQIEYLSTLWELKAGDLILTGTPAGVGAVNKGDRLKGHVQGLGDLDVTVV
jgi:fumarylpyruvate hydrolase